MAELYPNPKRLFDFLKNKAGRKSVYTPRQIADEFVLYIQDLKNTPIESETSYKRQRAEDEQDNASEPREINIRTERYQRPPKVMDFVVRWLGMSHQWWYALENGIHGEQYKQVSAHRTVLLRCKVRWGGGRLVQCDYHSARSLAS